jgi:hypothetical protein
MGERELDALVREVDELHHGAMGAAPVDSVAGDIEMATFAASVERALVALYAIGAPKLSGAALRMATTFATHHHDHANAFDLAGAKPAGQTANAHLVAAFAPRLASAVGQNAVLELAFGLESSAAATYQHALDGLRGAPTVKVVASIMPVEGQHAIVIGTLLGKDLKRELIPRSSQSTVGWLDPGKYPVS